MTEDHSTENEESVVELTETEKKDVDEHVSQRSPVIFEIVRRKGEEELNRPWGSLWWSGLAAGIGMGFSILAQAFLHRYLPVSEAWVLIERMGYTIGFVLIIAANQQLFTENTLTTVVPTMTKPTLENFTKTGKVWSTVLLANIVGTTLFAAFVFYTKALDEETKQTIVSLSTHAMSFTGARFLFSGVGAGFLIASLVWILANLGIPRVGVIILITYMIALAQFSHIVAGSVEAAIAVMAGTISFREVIASFFFPTLLGNILGGTILFAMLMYGQTRLELNEDT